MNAHPVFLFRHGETEWNATGRIQGRLDSPLTARGREQARAMGVALKAIAGAACRDMLVFASPLGRVRETLSLAAETAGLDVAGCRFDDTLREITWGEWDGMTRAEIDQRAPGAMAERERAKWGHAPPGGESYQAAALRVRPFLDAVLAQAADRPVALFSHGAVGRVLRGLYMALPGEDIVLLDEPQDAFYRLQAGGVARIDAAG
ncbi:MAG: histidine phosphatase family protein [Alphaproteobacteria bacterium]|nr:histidine phosphatase family protein [Alphaproteobacteria bacterium]MCW5742128.1 histidine phosphatase family protein [Alphaproteobacteria bacterium]